MSALTAVNNTSFPALLIIKRGALSANALQGRVAVGAGGGRVSVPPGEVLQARASIVMDDGNTYTTGVVTLSGGAQTLTAQMLVIGGAFDFQIEVSAGEVPDQLTLINTCRRPVTFMITIAPADAPNVPSLSRGLVVASYEDAAVSTAESYAFQAIVNGITTAAIVSDPGQSGQALSIGIHQDETPIGDWTSYSVAFEAPAD